MSIARSYWTHCYKLSPEDKAFYLIGTSVYATREQVSNAVEKLNYIPLLSRSETINLRSGLVRDVLRDFIGAANARAQKEFQEVASTWGRR